MNISELFNKKKPVVSFEISPPKRKETLSDIDGTLKLLSHDVDGIHIYTTNHPAVAGRICEGQII